MGDVMTHRGKIGKRVIDSEGVELGVVGKDESDLIEVSEGLFDELLLSTSYIGREEEEQIVLKDTIFNLLSEMDVLGSDNEMIGKVKETISAGDVLDTLIIETEDRKLLFITLEEIFKIDEKMWLDVTLENLKEDERLSE